MPDLFIRITADILFFHYGDKFGGKLPFSVASVKGTDSNVCIRYAITNVSTLSMFRTLIHTSRPMLKKTWYGSHTYMAVHFF